MPTCMPQCCQIFYHNSQLIHELYAYILTLTQSWPTLKQWRISVDNSQLATIQEEQRSYSCLQMGHRKVSRPVNTSELTSQPETCRNLLGDGSFLNGPKKKKMCNQLNTLSERRKEEVTLLPPLSSTRRVDVVNHNEHY